MPTKRSWLGAVGSIWLAGSKLADVSEWRFNIAPPYAINEGQSAVELLIGVNGHFIIDKGSVAVTEAVRQRETVLLRCDSGMGVFEVQLNVDSRLVDQPGVVVEYFEFIIVDH